MVRGDNKKLFPKWAVRGNCVHLVSRHPLKDPARPDMPPLVWSVMILRQIMGYGSRRAHEEHGLKCPTSLLGIPSVGTIHCSGGGPMAVVHYRPATEAEVAAHEAYWKTKCTFPKKPSWADEIR